jgi:4-hydroxy-tetrahydrodipicolinate synthase
MFHGVMTALLTPFKNGKIDEEAFRAHIERQIEAGVDGVVPGGSTGEAATLSVTEHKALIQMAVEQVAGRVPVIAGTGSNNTAESIALTQAAKGLGADASLLISPYYVKPTQEGIYQHYKTIADAVHIPQILYNVPGRTASNMEPETVAKLSHVSNIIAIKDATADMAQLTRTMMACDERIMFYSGDDASVLPFMTLGGSGVISVVSNIAPKTMKAITQAVTNNDFITAKAMHFALQNLTDAMFVESNPIPVKKACELLGWMSGDLRLPLTPLDAVNTQALKQVMADFNSGLEKLKV